MTKFIEIHNGDGEPFLVSLDRVKVVYKCRYGPWALMDIDGRPAESFQLRESYEEVRTMIASAQGGIPMEGSKMY